MKVLRGPLLTLATLAVVLLVAEFVLRCSVIRLDHASIHKLDPQLIFRQSSNAAKRVSVGTRNGVRRVIVRTNSQGFRGEQLEEGGTAKRVVVYGDSFIAAEFSELEDTFVAQLGAALGFRSEERIEAINAGVTSYGPDQAFTKLREELSSLAPDLIVFAIFAGNDFGDLVRNKMFRLGAGGRLVPNAFVVADSLVRSVEGSWSPWLLKNVVRAAWSRLRQAPQRRTQESPPIERWLKLRRAEYRSFVIDGDNTVTNAIFDSFDVDISLEPESESARYKQHLMAALLREVKRTADAAAIPIVFLVIPSGIDISTDYSWTIDAEQHPNYDRDAQCAALVRILSDGGLRYLSLLEPYRELDVNEIYFDWRDGHWNDEGQRVAAEWVAGYVIDEGLLVDGSR